MRALITIFAAAVLSAPLMAQAAEGFIVADIPLQSGPDDEYPPVDQLAAGTPVIIEGCIEGWTWCDVIAGDLRGWVPGTYIEQSYEGRWVYITDYGPQIGLPIVVFSVNTYWGAHYRSRPWFGEHERWAARSIQPRMPARPQGEAHAPPQRSMQHTPQPARHPAQPAQPANPPTPPNRPRTMPQTNPAPPPNAETRSIEPNPPREARPRPNNDARVPPTTERTAPAAPTSEPANKPQPPAPKAANPPRPKTENKPKAEPKPPAKKDNKDNQDHHDENNGHDTEM